MNIAVVTNITDGIGLAMDYKLLRELLEALGHEVEGFQFDDPVIVGKEGHFDVAIFLEVTPRNLLGLSERRWLFANPEWVKPDMIPIIDRSFEKIFAKTRDAERILEEVFPGRVHFTGFLTRDQFDPTIEREKMFLHVAGNSMLRGTEAVLDAWRWKKNGKRLDSQLIVVGKPRFDQSGFDESIVHFKERVSERELMTLQNRCLYHLYPSGTEGWGHALHESLSAGAMLITIGKPPMSEVEKAWYLGATKKGKYNLATIWETSALEIFEAVQCVKQMEKEHVEGLGNRSQYLALNEQFGKLFAPHLGSSIKKISRAARMPSDRRAVAFIGNFAAAESTENQIKWALENRLNYAVEELQENRVNLAAIREAMEWNDALLWVRTPKWLQVENQAMLDFLGEMVEKAHKPTISMHLDKFFSIPERERLVGRDAFWKTQFVFTADGSRDEDFKKLGVRHFWMQPAVSEVYVHPGTPYEHHRCDVGFVGASEYHCEYPFRKQLVEFLKDIYGECFKHITGIRGHDLNDFYASCRVAVGDHIFAGIPRYYSDRAPETAGRGGFLLYPKTEGLCIPCATYEPQNLDNLREQIDFWLAHEKDRREKICECMEHVRLHDTWTVRLRQILEMVR